MCDYNQMRSPGPSTVGVIDHVSSLSSNLGELIENSDYSDLTLVVENRKFQAHKVILAARSDYFRAMLFGGLMESQPETNEVCLQDTSAKAFEALLKYMYTGKMNLLEVKEEHLLDVLGMAHRYGFIELESSISDYLKSILNIRNVCLIYDLANMYNLTSLCKVCMEYMDRNASHILSSEAFHQLSAIFEVLIYNLANIYNLTTLCKVCMEYMDRNASHILSSEAFHQLSAPSVKELLSRDSFCAQEIDIFKSVKSWAQENEGEDPSEIITAVRLPLMTMSELLNEVRESSLVSPNAILDAIQTQTESRDMELQYRGFLAPEENIATNRLQAQVIRGEMKAALLDGDTINYDLDRGFTRHLIDDNNGQGIVIKLAQPYIINTIKLLLWDRDPRSYCYYIEISMDDKDYERIIDHTKYWCRSEQTLHFPAKVVRYIRVVGTHNTQNRVFHLVSFECLYTMSTFNLHQGLIVPSENVATIAKRACVIEGVSRSRNALINGETRQYDWDSGYTCHQLGSGCIIVQLPQPYMIDSMRLLLWDCDDRSYCYYIETSVDMTNWHIVCDKRNEPSKSWQNVVFPMRPVAFIKIVGTHNTANEVFHCVHFEAPSSIAKRTLSASPSTSDPSTSLQLPKQTVTGGLGRQESGDVSLASMDVNMSQDVNGEQEAPESEREEIDNVSEES